MKQSFTFFFTCICVLSRVAGAQPVVSMNEFYYVGDVINMVRCDPAGVNAGAAGAGVTWDFSGLQPSGGLAATTVSHDTSSLFTTSNLLFRLPDGKQQHVSENSTDTYLNGIYDPGTHLTTYYNHYDIAQRPVSYNTTYVDTYRVTVPATSTTGTGALVKTGDAYGTLKLPGGTYNNVLRIREFQSETDTTGPATFISVTTSYLWFDALHHAPLFRLDSMIDVTGASQDAMYLAAPEAVPTLASQPATTAYFLNNGLVITSNFDNSAVYGLEVYNIIGARVFATTFSPAGNVVQFPIAQPLSPGIYIASIVSKTNGGYREVLKVVKQ
jgi:hypothetical protein